MSLLRRWCRCNRKTLRSSQFYSKRVADGNLNDPSEISLRTYAMKSKRDVRPSRPSGLRSGPLAAAASRSRPARPDPPRLLSGFCSLARGVLHASFSDYLVAHRLALSYPSTRPAHAEDFHLHVTFQCWAHRKKRAEREGPTAIARADARTMIASRLKASVGSALRFEKFGAQLCERIAEQMLCNMGNKAGRNGAPVGGLADSFDIIVCTNRSGVSALGLNVKIYLTLCWSLMVVLTL